MSLGKKDIIKNISTKAHISNKSSQKLLNSFIDIVVTKTENSFVKISNFGTFYYHKSPERRGRNPLTKEEFKISKRSKLSLNTSQYIKNFLN